MRGDSTDLLCGESPYRLQVPEFVVACWVLGVVPRVVDCIVPADPPRTPGVVSVRAMFPVAARLTCDRLCCCWANGTRFTGAGWLWLKKRPLKPAVDLVDATARSENRRLEAVGVIGTCPLTKLADWS